MELIVKSAAAALTAAAVGLLIKKSNPEISMLLGACTTAIIMIAAMGFAKGIRELSETVKNIAGSSETLIAPVIKCLAVAIITKISADLCKDSSQSAAASALELAGTICAMSIALPAIMSVLNTIGGFL